MTAVPAALTRGGRTLRLKWHMARLRRGDRPFRADRIAAGLASGAAVEIDLRPTRDGGWVVLHDATLDRETTGTGPVRTAGSDELHGLRYRERDGTAGPPLLDLDGLDRLLASIDLHPRAQLQLDVKAEASLLDAGHAAGLGALLRRYAGSLVVSGLDWSAVRLIGDAAGPAALLGYDPCGWLAPTDAASDPAGAAAEILLRAPEARWVYLALPVLLAGGRKLVAPLLQAGRRIDAWTLEGVDDDTPRLIERLFDLGVEQVTTDDPAGVLALETA